MDEYGGVPEAGDAAAKVGSDAQIALRERVMKMKEERLKKEAKAAKRRALQKKRVLEAESRKRAREKVTIQKYFVSSRNADDRSELEIQTAGEVGGYSREARVSHNERLEPYQMRRHEVQALETRDSVDIPNAENRSELEIQTRKDTAEEESEALAVMGSLNIEGNLVSLDTAPAGREAPSIDIDLEMSIPDTVLVSSDSSAFVFSSDDPNFFDPRDVPRSESDLDLSDDEMEHDTDMDDFQSPSGKRMKTSKGKAKVAEGTTTKKSKFKKSYDLTRKFQTEWSAKLSWCEGILADDGFLHQVRCIVCTAMGKKAKVMAPKWHTLVQHDKRESHKRNLLLYAARQPTSVLEQLQGCNTIESRKKRVQLATLFQVLSDGRPMCDFSSRFSLYEFLHVPDLPSMHWTDGSGWLMAAHMYSFVKEKHKSMLSAASYIAVTADESTSVDNTSWIAIHLYVMQDWRRVPLLITIQKMESNEATADGLKAVIVGALRTHGGMEDAEIAKKLLCFGTDGVAAFHGSKTGVSKQILEKYAPFMIPIHCCAHRLQLCAKILSELGVMHDSEELLRMSHNYFAHSPKRAAEFRTLALMMESKGLKLLKNVKTRWISCLPPIRRLLAEYRPVMAKLHADKDDKKCGKKAKKLNQIVNELEELKPEVQKNIKCINFALSLVLDQMLDPHVLLGMLALLPLLEAIDTLIVFAQKRDVYIGDFVAALLHCEGQLFTFYIDSETAYRRDEFHAFNQVLDCNHEQILLKWDANLNLPCEQLAFVVYGETLYAMHARGAVTRESFALLIAEIKAECTDAAQQLLVELKARFPSHSVMDALGVVYPQYWLQGNCEFTFRKHLDVLKDFYGESKWVGTGEEKRLIPAMLDPFKLESEQPLFKLAMMSNAAAALEIPPGTEPSQVINPLTKLWKGLDKNPALVKTFSEYVKLAQIAMIHVLGSVEDERTFSSLNFLKDRLRNRLDGNLGVVVGMHAQKVFTLKTFPFDDCFKQWVHFCERHRYGVTG